ncbi:testis-expressed protein 2-like [Nothoprocta perdicaria]|uniref:testis-expressed protein 2-like n=1 Tax=Nothoprocta perdicaria TaxID=30464 RepID=UPI000E1C056C|nr:testis-expressed protein 2-like [Nothoprocta perdicaria]
MTTLQHRNTVTLQHHDTVTPQHHNRQPSGTLPVPLRRKPKEECTQRHPFGSWALRDSRTEDSGRRLSDDGSVGGEHPWAPALHCGYEIRSDGDLMQVLEVPPEVPPQPCPQPRPGAPVPGRALCCVAAAAYGYLVLPLPPFAAGLCVGLACGTAAALLLLVLLWPPRAVQSTQPRVRPRSPRDTGGLQGWLLTAPAYGTASAPAPQPVLATLRGAALTLSCAGPRRDAAGEQHDAPFGGRLDVSRATVSLAPHGLARKRMWNKKYPIHVLLPAEPPGTQPQAPGRDVDGDTGKRSLYLFGRTGREKEEWYQHLARACRGAQGSSHGEGRTGLGPALQSSPGGGSSVGSTEDIPSAVRARDLAGHVQQKTLLDYSTYMARVVPAPAGGSPTGPQRQQEQGPCLVLQVPGGSAQPGGDARGRRVAWVNALLGRVFWDVLREPYWARQVSSKIQKKLSKIKLPYFMNELTLTELDMGTSIPSVLSASSPTVDDRGLWVDVEVTYSGALQMTLETKVNLCKLGKEGAAEESGPAEAGAEGAGPRLCPLADSDAESPSASSSDEEAAAEPPGAKPPPPPGTEGPGGGSSTGRTILRFVDKIARSRCFQRATENEFIKKKMEEVSNTPLLLTVEVQELAGTLAVNVPPPPTDRVWYSFRAPPRLELSVRPRLGGRALTCPHVSEAIARRLQHELQKVLVMPNMDDLIIPIMHSGLDPHAAAAGLPRDLPAGAERL